MLSELCAAAAQMEEEPVEKPEPPRRSSSASLGVVSKLKGRADKASARIKTKREAQGKTPEGRSASDLGGSSSQMLPVVPTPAVPALAVGAPPDQPPPPRQTSRQSSALKWPKKKMGGLFARVRRMFAPRRKPKFGLNTEATPTATDSGVGPGTPRYAPSQLATMNALPAVPPSEPPRSASMSSDASGPGTPRYAENGPVRMLSAMTHRDSAEPPVAALDEVKLDVQSSAGASSLSNGEAQSPHGEEHERARARRALTLEAAKWTLVREIGPDGHGTTLADALREAWEGLKSRGEAPAALDDAAREDVEGLVDQVEAASIVEKVSDAKKVVIDPNMDNLVNHLDGMLKEHVEAAASGNLPEPPRRHAPSRVCIGPSAKLVYCSGMGGSSPSVRPVYRRYGLVAAAPRRRGEGAARAPDPRGGDGRRRAAVRRRDAPGASAASFAAALPP